MNFNPEMQITGTSIAASRLYASTERRPGMRQTAEIMHKLTQLLQDGTHPTQQDRDRTP